jgi:general secretion pathway protein K
MSFCDRRDSGLVLVVVLLILVLLVALVSEFAYETYTSVSMTENWKEMQALTVMAESATDVAVHAVSSLHESQTYTYPEELSFPVPVSDEESILIRIRDEQAKINLNRLIYPNGSDNQRVISLFRRLCDVLQVEESIVDRVLDWIDRDSTERLTGSEEGAKNAPLYSIGELQYIKGITPETLQKLIPYLSAYYDRSGVSDKININTAPKEVIMALHEEIDSSMAENVILYRKESPFERPEQIKNISGFEKVYAEISPLIAVRSGFFRIIVTATNGSLKSTVEEIVDIDNSRVLFYRVN